MTTNEEVKLLGRGFEAVRNYLDCMTNMQCSRTSGGFPTWIDAWLAHRDNRQRCGATAAWEKVEEVFGALKADEENVKPDKFTIPTIPQNHWIIFGDQVIIVCPKCGTIISRLVHQVDAKNRLRSMCPSALCNFYGYVTLEGWGGPK